MKSAGRGDLSVRVAAGGGDEVGELSLELQPRLLRFLEQLEDAKSGNEAETGWSGWQLKRYRDYLWLHRREPPFKCAESTWSSGMTLELGDDSGRYRLLGSEAPIPGGWRVGRRDRRGGRRARSAGRR